MTGLQKLVKYAATALAVVLIINIFFGVFTAFAAIGFIFESFGVDSVSGSDSAITNKTDFTADILEIELDTSKLVITESSALSFACSDSSVKIAEVNGILKISEDRKAFNFNDNAAEIMLYVPSETVFEKVDITSGAGKIKIDSLNAERIYFELGAGTAEINRLSAKSSAEISVGAGKLDIKSGDFRNLSLALGVGSAQLNAKLSGNCNIDYGIGNADITLSGNKDDYKIDFDNGISRAYMSGEAANSETVYGDGDNRISINGAIGSVSVDFSDKAK